MVKRTRPDMHSGLVELGHFPPQFLPEAYGEEAL